MSKYGYTDLVTGIKGIGKHYLFEHQEEFNLEIAYPDIINCINKDATSDEDKYSSCIEVIKDLIGQVQLIILDPSIGLINYLYKLNYHPYIVFPDKITDEYIIPFKKYLGNTGETKELWKSLLKQSIYDHFESNYKYYKYRLKEGQHLSDIPLNDAEKMCTIHFQFQNDNKEKIKNVSTCAICGHPINNHENYFTNNDKDICIFCASGIRKAYNKIDGIKTEIDE